MLAIIGGTGIYQIDGVHIVDEITIKTPFCKTSATVLKATYQGREFLFLARHGNSKKHLLPHEINYRANIFALKKLGAKQVLGISATGSLRADLHPGEFALPNQYFDFVKGNRIKTFFGDGLAAHVSTAAPVCPHLSQWVKHRADAMKLTMHTDKTYACVDGPRLGTKAESNFLRMAGCDLVGMTNVPEVFLAREAQLAYAAICIITDYDCWMEDPKHHVSVADVIARYGESLNKALQLLLALLATKRPTIDATSSTALKFAMLTPEHAIPEHQRELFEVLKS